MKDSDNQGRRETAQNSMQRSRETEFRSLQEAIDQENTPLQTTEEVRAARIRSLKEQVRKGTYRPNLRKVAQILVHDDTDALLGRS